MSNDPVADFVQTNFPTYTWALSVPELKQVFASAMTGQISQGQALSQLYATGWWQSHGSNMRQYMSLQNTDPASLADQIRAKDADVHAMETQMGANLSPEDIDRMARLSLQWGWNDQELREQITAQGNAGKPISFDPSAPMSSNLGTIDNAIMSLKQMAGQYLVPLDDQTAFNMAREVAAGRQNVQDYQPLFAQQAVGRFPSLNTFIKQGITPQQIVQPLQNEAARLLEVIPDQVDLMNNLQFSKIISYTDPKTNEPRPMTFSEEQSYLRGLDRWKNTAQSQQSVADITEGILQIFGKTPSGSYSNISGPSNAY